MLGKSDTVGERRDREREIWKRGGRKMSTENKLQIYDTLIILIRKNIRFIATTINIINKNNDSNKIITIAIQQR